MIHIGRDRLPAPPAVVPAAHAGAPIPPLQQAPDAGPLQPAAVAAVEEQRAPTIAPDRCGSRACGALLLGASAAVAYGGWLLMTLPMDDETAANPVGATVHSFGIIIGSALVWGCSGAGALGGAALLTDRC